MPLLHERLNVLIARHVALTSLVFQSVSRQKHLTIAHRLGKILTRQMFKQTSLEMWGPSIVVPVSAGITCEYFAVELEGVAFIAVLAVLIPATANVASEK